MINVTLVILAGLGCVFFIIYASILVTLVTLAGQGCAQVFFIVVIVTRMVFD